jgi:DnaJ-class molecular chaperone
MSTESLYDILGVSKDATHEEIHAAYRQQAKKTHPDAGGSANAFQAVAKAYAILSDPAKRTKYDDTGHIDDGADNLDAMALELIEQLLAEFLKDDSAKYLDVVKMMRDHLQGGQERCEGMHRGLMKQETRIVDMIKRFKTRSSKNMVSLLLTRKLQRVRSSIVEMEMAVAAHKRAQEIMADYSFDREKNPMSTMVFNVNNML